MKYKYRRNLTKTRQTVKTITQLNEGPWRWHLGVQAGVATGVTMSAFIFSGFAFAANIASLGALSVLYGARRTGKERLLIVGVVGIGLVLASVAGIVCSSPQWLNAAALIFITTVTSIITAGTGIGAPGPVMFVLIAAISSQIAVQPAPSAFSSVYVIPLLIGAGAFLAWIVVVIADKLPFKQSIEKDPDLPELTYRLSIKKEDWLVIGRTVFGVLAAILLSKPLGIVRVHWVIVAVTAILQGGYDRQLTTARALQRVLGTVLGVVLFELLHLIGVAGLWFVLVVALLQFATQVVIARNYVLGLLFITPMALLIANHTYAGDTYITTKERVVDTLLGAGLAIVAFWIEEVVNFIWMKRK